MTKKKEERQKWWKGLTAQQQDGYIAKVCANKAIKRKKVSLRRMKKYDNKFSCSTCFHRKGASCTDNLPNGCEYWWSPDSSYQGIAYK